VNWTITPCGAVGHQADGTQHLGRRRAASRGEHRGRGLREQQQGEQDPQRGVGQRHECQDRDDDGTQEVGAQHERASGVAVGEAAEQRATEERRNDRDRERRRREEHGAGVREDEERESDPGDLVAGLAGDLREEHAAVLAHAEHVAQTDPRSHSFAPILGQVRHA
jgi:hypothetical protein